MSERPEDMPERTVYPDEQGSEAPAHMASPAPEEPSPATAPAAAAPAAGDSSSPETTAEIDADAVNALVEKDLGNTQSFAPITQERIDADSCYDAGTSSQLMWGARSDVGCVRSHNEDSYLVQPPLFVVADGMGGHAAGEVASGIAVETISKMAPTVADPAMLGRAVEAANISIIEAAESGRGKPGMGCTADAAFFEKDKVAIAHVGDSRVSLLHEGTLIRVTHDHSFVEELVDAGEITADEARNHPSRSVITRALGSDPYMYADHFQLNIEQGDRLILCSDGLSGMILDRDIEDIAVASETPQLCADNLVDAALAAGGSDNVTVVVVDVVDDGRLQEVRRKRRRNALIATVCLLVALIVACVGGITAIRSSYYLGVKDGFVAVYSGIPHSFLGIDLFWLQDETTVDLDDLPEDTRSRLKEGIAQPSLEDARDTVMNYVHQIEEERAQDELRAQSIQSEQSGEAAPVEGDAASAQGGAA